MQRKCEKINMGRQSKCGGIWVGKVSVRKTNMGRQSKCGGNMGRQSKCEKNQYG